MLKPALLGLLLATGCVVGEDATGLPGGPPQQEEEEEEEEQPELEVPNGQIQMSASTVPQGTAGGFAPSNALVVWAEDAQGNFVKTIERRSAIRTVNLVAWNAAAGPGDVDSVSGASRVDHATPLTFTWKLKDRAKQPIPDGTYTIRMEVAEVNSITADQNQQATFTFTKGPTAQMQTGLTNGGVSNVSIAFTPPAP